MRSDVIPAQGVSAVPRSFLKRVVPLHLSERKLLLLVVDLICVNLALATAISVRYELPWKEVLSHQPAWYLVLTSLWITVTLLLGSYDLRRAARLKSGAVVGVVTSLTVAVAYLLIPYVAPPLPESRISLLFFIGAMMTGLTVWRSFYALVLVNPVLGRRALVVGAGEAGRAIGSVILRNAPAEFELVGFVDDGSGMQGGTVGGVPVLGTGTDLEDLARETGATDIVVAVSPERMRPELFRGIMNCYERGLEITQMPVLFEQLTGCIPVEYVGSNFQTLLPLNGRPIHLQRAVKRLFDLAIALVGMALTALLIPAVWLLLRLESPGPIFYRQARVGRGGRIFDLVKFRTMVINAEVEGPRWAGERDLRVTRIGRFIRLLHLDEVPQAINILRGEMSFVGPRPERPEFVGQLEREIPLYRARHVVRPGVTGWAQVNFRYGASVGDSLTKLRHDLFYIKHQSVWLDFVISVRTVGLVLTLRGR